MRQATWDLAPALLDPPVGSSPLASLAFRPFHGLSEGSIHYGFGNIGRAGSSVLFAGRRGLATRQASLLAFFSRCNQRAFFFADGRPSSGSFSRNGHLSAGRQQRGDSLVTAGRLFSGNLFSRVFPRIYNADPSAGLGSPIPGGVRGCCLGGGWDFDRQSSRADSLGKLSEPRSRLRCWPDWPAGKMEPSVRRPAFAPAFALERPRFVPLPPSPGTCFPGVPARLARGCSVFFSWMTPSFPAAADGRRPPVRQGQVFGVRFSGPGSHLPPGRESAGSGSRFHGRRSSPRPTVPPRPPSGPGEPGPEAFVAWAFSTFAMRVAAPRSVSGGRDHRRNASVRRFNRHADAGSCRFQAYCVSLPFSPVLSAAGCRRSRRPLPRSFPPRAATAGFDHRAKIRPVETGPSPSRLALRPLSPRSASSLPRLPWQRGSWARGARRSGTRRLFEREEGARLKTGYGGFGKAFTFEEAGRVAARIRYGSPRNPSGFRRF